MKNNKVRLTESQLHNVIKESVKNILIERFSENDCIPSGWQIDYDDAQYFDENILKTTQQNIEKCRSIIADIRDAFSNDITAYLQDKKIKKPTEHRYYQIENELTRMDYELENIQKDLAQHYRALRDYYSEED